MQKEYRLQSCVWEITLACCFSCKYCGSKGGKARENELSTNECYRLTECILNQYCATGLFDNNGIYENDEIKGINWSKIPVTNILLGCISDVSDEQKLADQSNWEMMAEGIANGIDEYFSMQ